MTRPAASPFDADALRRLIAAAARGGEDAAWLTRVADAGVGALLELAELRRCADPRRRRTIAEARRAARLYGALRASDHEPGDAVAALRERTGWSRSKVYRLLAEPGVRPDIPGTGQR